MEIVKIVGLGLLAGMLISLLRQQKPEIAMQLSIAAGVMLFVLMMARVLRVVEVMQTLASRASLDQAHMDTVLKIIGIAYVADFGAQVLQDAGERAVATKVEMAGKIIIMLLAVPIVLAVLDAILNLLGQGWGP
ncbi:stage III sporulation protein AD [Symbiobacterium terraclitae]|uniref:stage III sporulation protein AD n=1 Tax=Symbiobacterium terraclitae TaxID=557451 RepID=UPI0035B51CC9